MRDFADALALILGYLVLCSVAGLFLCYVLTLAWDGVKPARKKEPGPLIAHFSGTLSPHPHHHKVLYVDADTAVDAWRVLGGPAA